MKKSTIAWDSRGTFKWINICIIGVLEGEEKGGAESLFRGIMVQNTHNMDKETDIQIQENL